ncbi:MAG: hypothetical protein SGJ07_08225 [Rhodospirillaceae bacterium]|nr:hypothetical protein [Rhodospirillaceae bacterium]
MIVYVTTRWGRRSLVYSLPLMPPDLRRRFRHATYEGLWRRRSLPVASYIFADIERLAPPAVARAAAIWETLAASNLPVRLFNHPARVLTRYRLLKALHRDGINDFDIHRADGPFGAIRYPVFLRHIDDHKGARSGLIGDPAALEAGLRQLEAEGLPRHLLLIVEFCDTADANGIYRKYDAFVAGERIVPFDIDRSSHWMVKWENAGRFEGRRPDEGAMIDESLAFLHGFGQQDRLRAIAKLAGVDFGRIDFALHGDRIQIWEINTNPDPALPQLLAPDHRAGLYGQRVLPVALDRLFDMFRSLDCARHAGIHINLPADAAR